jgi:hypothetical protein
MLAFAMLATIRHQAKCQVVEHCWDPVGHAIVAYAYRFERLTQARHGEV